MGLRVSPYLTIKALLLGMEWILGNTEDPLNVFHWSRVRLNLPGDVNYDPQHPWVSRVKVCGEMEVLAALLVAYVDDLRTVGSSEADCWVVMHHISSRLGYLGMQFAARKTRPPSLNPGPWAGSIVLADEDGIGIRCTQDKWDKAKDFLMKLLETVRSGSKLDRKHLERVRGFMVHIQQTYPAITPYLKGMHLTIDSWRPGRDSEGWKSAGQSPHGFWDDTTHTWTTFNNEPVEAPVFVDPVPRFETDLVCLCQLLSAPYPPTRYVRSKQVRSATYGFGDASGSGMGSSTLNGNTLTISQGVWGRREEAESSNYRELANLVGIIEQGLTSGSLVRSKVFLFTDNSTAEAVFWNGTSRSKLLFELALKLRLLEMRGDFQLHFIHIAGTRMIVQGTDGLSRGCLSEGIMSGTHMMDFVPIHLSALQRQPTLLSWIQCWSEQPQLQPLSPEDWYRRGQGFRGVVSASGIWSTAELPEAWFLWTPPPAAADAALEALNESRIKRTHLNHIFVCPRIMTYHWCKRLYRLADLVFEVPPGELDCWPSFEHEPLIVGLILRFSIHSPWQVKESTLLLGVDRQLREMWACKNRFEWTLLRQLCQLPRLLDGL